MKKTNVVLLSLVLIVIIALFASEIRQRFILSSAERQRAENIEKLIELWVNRYIELGNKDFIKYVFIFENRGEEVGVTITHPHGQIYGFPFIPKKIEIELSSCKEYYETSKKNLYLEILKEELKQKIRIVDENDFFVTFVPYFADYPYQVFIIPRGKRLSIDEFSREEKIQLGESLKRIVSTYDNLFERDFPYMMCFHQQPTDGKDYSYYQFHIEFYPPLRSEKTQKFNASSETGSWTHGNPTSPEEIAKELRKTMEKLYGMQLSQMTPRLLTCFQILDPVVHLSSTH